MIDDLRKDLSSFKLLVSLGIIAICIYLIQFAFGFLTNFADIIWIIILGWLLSFVMEPFVDAFTKYLRLPRSLSTVLVFLLAALFILFIFILFIPDITKQFQSFQQTIPQLLETAPPQVKSGLGNFIGSINTSVDFIPSVTQFFINTVTVLILSFYLVLDKDNLNKKIYALTPRKYHEPMRFIQKVIDSSFANFVRIQVLWGVVGGITTYAVLAFFGVGFAASTSLLAGILTAVPVIGPIIGVIPPLLVALVEKPDQAIIIFLIIFIIQQFIFNVIGPKIIGRAFNVNPIIVILSLLIGIKVAGFVGAILAIPVISILLVVIPELYNQYFKDKEVTS